MEVLGIIALILLVGIEVAKGIVPNRFVKGKIRLYYIIATALSSIMEIVIIIWLFYNRFIAKDLIVGSTSVFSFVGCFIIIVVIMVAQIWDIRKNIELWKEEGNFSERKK